MRASCRRLRRSATGLRAIGPPVALGASFGAAIGAAFEYVGTGVALRVGLGIVLGTVLSQSRTDLGE
jgi:uncharacterized membrane protein